MQDEWIFVFPVDIKEMDYAIAIFPPEMLEEAIEYVGKSSFLEIRKSTWRFGEVPCYESTLPLKL